MIEKFSPEELAQIRRELHEKDRVAQKDRLLQKQFSRALGILSVSKVPEIHDSFSTFDVKSALALLVDHALKNYVINEKRSKPGQRALKRNPLVPGEMEERYLAAYTKVVDTLEEIAEPWTEIE